MRNPLLGAAAVLSLILGLGGCGGNEDKSANEIKEDLSAELQAGDTFDEEAADCFADVNVDDIGADKLQDVDLADDEPPADLQEEFTAAATRAIDECGPSDSPG